jgi:hypothetical protein
MAMVTPAMRVLPSFALPKRRIPHPSVHTTDKYVLLRSPYARIGACQVGTFSTCGIDDFPTALQAPMHRCVDLANPAIPHPTMLLVCIAAIMQIAVYPTVACAPCRSADAPQNRIAAVWRIPHVRNVGAAT